MASYKMLQSKKYYKFTNSKSLLRSAEKHEAWAANRRKNYSQFEGSYPFYATRAKGAYIWDADGNKFIDYMCGYGTIILGHAHKRVTDAFVSELRNGNNISPLWKPQQIELTKLLTQIIPGAEMAFLMKTGSDATSGAIRLARAFTGRNKVIRWGYNGWHDWASPNPNGIPESVKSDILHFNYNDIKSLKNIFRKHPKDIACVIMMPFELEKPQPGFLEEVKSVAHKYGALFILDEMRSGFRIALGGAQEYFNIKADLATFSKAMSNGHPVSAIVGRKDVLSGIANTKVTSTFFGNSPEMAAAIETIKTLKETDAISKIWKLGEHFEKGIKTLILKHDFPAYFVGYPPFPYIEFKIADEDMKEKVKKAFYSEATKRGIFLHPNHHWYITASHTKKDINETLVVLDIAFSTASKALKKNKKYGKQN